MPCEGLDRSVFKQKIFLKKPSLTSQLMSKLFQDLNPSTQSMILVLQKLSSDDQPFNSNGLRWPFSTAATGGCSTSGRGN